MDFITKILFNELVHIAPTGLSVGIIIYLWFLDRRINDLKERLNNCMSDIKNRIKRIEKFLIMKKINMARIKEVTNITSFGQFPEIVSLLQKTIIPEKIRIKVNFVPDFTINVANLIQPTKKSSLVKLLNPRIYFIKENQAYEVNPLGIKRFEKVSLTKDLIEPTWLDKYGLTVGILIVGLILIGVVSVGRTVYDILKKK